MNNTDRPALSPGARIAGTLGLALLAVTGNVLSVPLFFGVSFIFGSIAAMLAVALLGTVPAVLVAIAGGLYTVVLWGHPYALVIFTAEALAVSQLYRRGLRNLVLADLAYWLVLGAPLVLLFYRGAIGMGWEAALLIALKQPLNGLFNALLAGLLILGLQLSWNGARRMGLGSARLASLLFHVLLTAILLAGAVPLIQEGYRQRVQQEAFMAERLHEQARHLAARLAAEPGLDRARWHAHLAAEQENASMGLALLATDGRVLASRGEVVSVTQRPGRLQALEDGLAIWLPTGDIPTMPRWKQGRYQISVPVGGVDAVSRVVIEQAAEPLVRTLERKGLNLFLFLAGLLLLGILASRALSRWLTRPLSELEMASRQLTAQIASGTQPVLPGSPVQEYSGLGNSLREMSGLLAESFRELREAQSDLEQRIDKRTAELHRTAGLLENVLAAASEFSIIATDADGVITIFNRGAERLLGYAAVEMVGKQTPALIHLPDEVVARATELSAELGRPIKGFRVFVEKPEREGSETREWTYLRKDGQPVPVSLVVTAMRDASGEITGYLGIAEDITERRQAQQALNQFKSTLDRTLDCVFMFDADTLRFFYANEGALKQVGYSREELLAMHPFDITPDITEVQFREMIASLLAGEQASLTFETVHRHKHGQRVPVEIFLQYIAPAGEPARFVAIVRDIAERKVAELELRESELRFRSMLETCPTAARIARAGGHDVIFSNKRYAELINAAPEQVIGVDPSAYYAHAEDYADILLRLGKGEQIFDKLVELTIPGAGTKWALASYLPIHYQGGPAVLGWFYDITDRKRDEAVLQEQAQHTQAILDNMVDGIITIDEKGIIDSYNPAAERIFGYETEEVLGQNVKMLMPNPHRDAHDSYLRNYRATGVARIIGIGREVEGQRKDGSLFSMELAVSEVRRQGSPLFVGMVRDITERKRMERMKSEFVSTVSHELRTPLTSISGALGLLAGGALGSLPDQVRSMVDIAHKNSQRLSHLINDLLDMEKIAAGKMHFEMQPHALLPLIEQALEANRAYGAERRVGLALTHLASGIEVRVDSQRLMQILSNLLSNAVKYSPEDGTVEIAVQRLDGHVRVTVTDHGPGIPAAFRACIFQKFSQADSSDTRQKGGTGLGLAITKELVERMGGRVGFESVEGEGASFFFEFPLWNADAPNPATISLDFAPAADAPRILVVEDEPDIAQLLSMMLARAGYAVDTVNSGIQALQALRQSRYAAMSLDLMLPDISGLEIVRQVRQQPETANLPIIVVSAKMEEGRLTINGDFSDVDWLAKPIDERRLLAAVEKNLPPEHNFRPRVLHVEDDADLHRVIRAMVGGRYEFELATSLAEARARVALECFDVVILDLSLPDGSGWDLLPALRALRPAPRIVILSGTEMTPDEVVKVEAALLKSNVSPRALLDAIHNSIHQTSLTEDPK